MMNKQRRNVLAGGAVLLAAGVGMSVKALAQDRVIPVVARKFVFLPNDIHLKKGETVILEFTAPEVVMGFFCPELKLRQMIIPGQKPTVRWTADRAGQFDFLCDVFCGDGHEGMAGRIVVS